MISEFPPNPRNLLQLLTRTIPVALEQEVIGLYVYGSLVTGGYDDGVSDVDLLAVTNEDVNDDELEHLRLMHARIEEEHPQWSSRVEVAYLSASGLRSFKTVASPMVNISPGEPIHRIRAGKDWLMNWYLVRTGSVTLIGPSPESLIPEISRAEFVDAVAKHALNSSAWSNARCGRKSQSYAILTMCRALHTLRTTEHHSKQESAEWAQQRFPEWSELIAVALKWRREPDHAPRFPIHPEGAALIAFLGSEVLNAS